MLTLWIIELLIDGPKPAASISFLIFPPPDLFNTITIRTPGPRSNQSEADYRALQNPTTIAVSTPLFPWEGWNPTLLCSHGYLGNPTQRLEQSVVQSLFRIWVILFFSEMEGVQGWGRRFLHHFLQGAGLKFLCLANFFFEWWERKNNQYLIISLICCPFPLSSFSTFLHFLTSLASSADARFRFDGSSRLRQWWNISLLSVISSK